MIITLLRKPLEGTVAENVLKHECGAINIDATRIGSEIMVSRAMGSLGVMHDDNWESKPVEPTESTGRWPANFILTHKEGCELKGTKKVEGNRKDSRPEGDGGRKDKSEWRFRPTSATKRGYSDEDGKETIADWACVEGCPVKELDQQSGHLKSGKDVNPTTSKVSGFFGGKDNYYSSKSNYGDEGGASRFFKQFKKEDNHDRD
jgi:hypothetical protein